MMLRSFAEATQKWARQYPNLEIKVYLPEGISESDMQNIYRDLNKFQGTD
jgi:cell division protein FtsX